MKTIIWRYRPRIGATLGPPVEMKLPDKPHRWVSRLRRRVDETTGVERERTLNEITTIMDLHAVFPEASFDYYEGTNGSV